MRVLLEQKEDKKIDAAGIVQRYLVNCAGINCTVLPVLR